MESEDKKRIRQSVISLRDRMDALERTTADQKILQRVLELIDTIHNPAKLKKVPVTIFLYASYHGEVDTWELFRILSKMEDVRIGFPRIVSKKLRKMDFFEVNSMEDLTEGAFGILEPKQHCSLLDPADSKKCILIMPGVAFDHDRHRLGYGGGYYDRYIEKLSNESQNTFVSIALAYELQLLEDVPQGPFDRTPDYLVTQERIYQ